MMGMKMKKNWVLPVLAAGILASGLTGCEKKDPYGLSAKNPVTITIWHYYNGVQKEGFDQLVQTFNESEGREKGIIVEAYSKGSIDDLSQAVTDSIDKKIGSDPIPDVFAAYADKVYEIGRRGKAVDLSKNLTAEEIGEYVDAYIEERRLTEARESRYSRWRNQRKFLRLIRQTGINLQRRLVRQTRLFPPGRESRVWQRSIINGRTA